MPIAAPILAAVAAPNSAPVATNAVVFNAPAPTSPAVTVDGLLPIVSNFWLSISLSPNAVWAWFRASAVAVTGSSSCLKTLSSVSELLPSSVKELVIF